MSDPMLNIALNLLSNALWDLAKVIGRRVRPAAERAPAVTRAPVQVVAPRALRPIGRPLHVAGRRYTVTGLHLQADGRIRHDLNPQ